MRDLKSPWDLALPPHRCDDWISEMRQDQAERLEAARDHDRAAIGAIENTRAALPKPGE